MIAPFLQVCRGRGRASFVALPGRGRPFLTKLPGPWMRLLCCLAGARPRLFDKAAGAVGLYHFPPCSSSCFPAPQQAFVGEMGQRRASLAWSSTFFENGRNLVSKSSAEPHGPAAGQQSKLSTVPAAGEKTMGHAPLLKLSGPWVYITSTPAPVPVFRRHNKLS